MAYQLTFINLLSGYANASFALKDHTGNFVSRTDTGNFASPSVSVTGSPFISSPNFTGAGNTTVSLLGSTVIISGTSTPGGPGGGWNGEGMTGISISGGPSISGKINLFTTGFGLSLFTESQNVYISGTEPAEIIVACADEVSPLTAGTGKVTFRMPYNMYLTGVKASVNAPASGASIIGDINQSGISILASGIFINTGHTTSRTSSNFPTILTNFLTGEQEIRMDVDSVSSGGRGYKITLLGHRM